MLTRCYYQEEGSEELIERLYLELNKPLTPSSEHFPSSRLTYYHCHRYATPIVMQRTLLKHTLTSVRHVNLNIGPLKCIDHCYNFLWRYNTRNRPMINCSDVEGG